MASLIVTTNSKEQYGLDLLQCSSGLLKMRWTRLGIDLIFSLHGVGRLNGRVIWKVAR